MTTETELPNGFDWWAAEADEHPLLDLDALRAPTNSHRIVKAQPDQLTWAVLRERIAGPALTGIVRHAAPGVLSWRWAHRRDQRRWPADRSAVTP